MYAGVGILLAALVTAIVGSLTTQGKDGCVGMAHSTSFGSFIIVLGIFMRLHMQETPHYEEIKKEGKISKRPIRDALRFDWRAILRVVILWLWRNLVFHRAHVPGDVSRGHRWHLRRRRPVVGTASAAALCHHRSSLALADRVGRKPPMFWSAVCLVVLPVLMFLPARHRILFLIYIATLVLLVPVMAFVGESRLPVPSCCRRRIGSAGSESGTTWFSAHRLDRLRSLRRSRHCHRQSFGPGVVPRRRIMIVPS